MNDRKPQPTPAAKPRPNPNSGPVQLHPASLARDFSGRPTGIFAGPHPITEGTPVLTVDEQFRSGCTFEGRDTAQKVLGNALERFIKGGARVKFDELAAQLERTYQDIAIEKELARGYRAKAKQLTDDYGDPDEVLTHEDAAADSAAKVQALERTVPVLVRQLAAERELVQKTLESHLRSALLAFQNEHLSKAAQIEQEALKTFLPSYAQAVSERIIAQSADRLMLDAACSSVVLDGPKRPNAEKPAQAPAIYTTFAGAAS